MNSIGFSFSSFIFLSHPYFTHSTHSIRQEGTFMDSYQSLLDKISMLQKKASVLRETKKKRVVAEIRRQIELYDVQPAELFSNVKPRAGRPASASVPVSARGRQVRQIKPSKPPKYRDPATGKTWNGHGKTPLWLVGISDRSAYLIDAQADAASAINVAAKPQEKVQKAKPAAGRKPKAAKGTVRRGAKRETAPKAEEPAIPPEVS
jgi:DNA-binding protein H-NS